MNAGASTYAVPSPIKGSGTAWVLLGSWALSPARPTPIHPRHECRGFSAFFGDDEVVQSGCEATPAPVSPPEGEGRQRGRPQPPPAVHVLIRLRDFKGAVLAFMADWRVPFDHNQGERDMRMVQVKQQVSGGCRTLEGAKRFGRIRGDISTARQQAKNVFEALRDAFDGNPFIPFSERP